MVVSIIPVKKKEGSVKLINEKKKRTAKFVKL